MDAVVRGILVDAGATDETIAVMEALARTLRAEAQDMLASAGEVLPHGLQIVGRVYFARVLEATAVAEYERWRTDDTPEA